MSLRSLGLLLAFSLVTAGPGAAAPRPVFTDVTREAGITFRHSFGDHDLSNIVEGTGSGGMFFDHDGDGDLDIYLVNGAWTPGVSDNRGRDLRDRLSNALYRNNGDGTFTDITAEAGVGDRGFGFGCSAADYDEDGDLDLYVLNYGPNVLYRNEGGGRFKDVSAQAGLADPRWSLSGPWLDYDEDGDLDLYVVNYLEYDEGAFRSFYAAAGYPGPLSYAGQPDALYRNNGDGTFTDVTEAAGVLQPDGRGMSGVAADLDDDGHVDIFVANDAMANFFFRNLGDGRFQERANLAGVAFGEHGQGVSSMGAAVGDVDGNGRLDLLVPDMGYGSLLVSRGALFEDRVTTSKLALIMGQYTGWGGVLFDYDNDGDLDAFVSNGNAHHEYTEEDVLAANDGRGVFEDVAGTAGDYFKQKYVGRGATFGDYDNDGDLDLLVVNLNAPARLLRNDGGDAAAWLQVSALLPGSRRDALGARITVSAGGREQVRVVAPVVGYLSQADPRAHFGLGEAEKADRIEVRWPGGGRSVQTDVPARQHVTIVREPGAGQAGSGGEEGGP